MGAEYSGRLFHVNIWWLIGNDAWPTQWHGWVTEWTESQLCWTIHRQQADCEIAILTWFFIPLNQLNISMQERSKIFLMCPWDRRVQRQNKVENPSNWMWKNNCFSGIERICRMGRFALHLSNIFWAPHCICGSWTNISLLTIRSKHLIGAKGFLRCQNFKFIMEWIALLNSWLSCKVNSCRVFNLILSGCPDNGIKSLICVSKKQKLIFQLHTAVKLFFKQYNYF